MAVDVDPAGQLTTSLEPEIADEVINDPADLAANLDERQPLSHAGTRRLLALGLVIVVIVGGLFAWLSYCAREARLAEDQEELYLQVGKQAALNLTTIRADQADADVQRILDSSAGHFHDDFAEKASAFVDVVKKAKSTTEGSVIAAGLESESPDKSDVLVAVAVKTTTADAPEAQTRSWRMRITVQRVPEGAKVANVVFVP